jgi:hypothetical protein
MRRAVVRRLVVAGVVCGALAAGCSGRSSKDKPGASSAATGKLAALQLQKPEGWALAYDKQGDAWRFEKARAGGLPPVLGTLAVADDKLPPTPEELIDRRKHEYPQGSKIELVRKDEIRGGYLLVWTVRASAEATDKTWVFHAVWNPGAVRLSCRSDSIGDQALLEEALTICKSASP